MNMTEERKASVAQMLAKLEGIKFEPKELINDWILLTYDIPAGAEGNKARYEFIKHTNRIGAVMHTRSVYLMPWSEEAEIAALKVTKAGQAYLWQTHARNEEKQKELTSFYDKEINERLDDIRHRIYRINLHFENEEYVPANRMIKKTGELLNDIVTAATFRFSSEILARAALLYKELLEVGKAK
jgi:hypothetical protein